MVWTELMFVLALALSTVVVLMVLAAAEALTAVVVAAIATVNPSVAAARVAVVVFRGDNSSVSSRDGLDGNCGCASASLVNGCRVTGFSGSSGACGSCSGGHSDIKTVGCGSESCAVAVFRGDISGGSSSDGLDGNSGCASGSLVNGCRADGSSGSGGASGSGGSGGCSSGCGSGGHSDSKSVVKVVVVWGVCEAVAVAAAGAFRATTLRR